MALTATQRADLQADIGITSDEAVFTNDELDRLYARAENDYNTAVYLALRQLLANAVKFHDYTAAQTKVQRSQVYDHLKEMVSFWKDEARVAGKQMRIVGMNQVPPRPGNRSNPRHPHDHPYWEGD